MWAIERTMLSAYFPRRTAALIAALALPCAAQLASDFKPESLPLDRIIGTPVQSTRGEPLGSIKDLVIDRSTGKVEYVAIERPGGQADVVIHPVGALVAGERGEMLLDPDYGVSSAAGASAPGLRHAFATRDLGASEDLVLDLPEGKVGFAPR
jgi:sporulation protein YlmC with PRC-barrel domain